MGISKAFMLEQMAVLGKQMVEQLLTEDADIKPTYLDLPEDPDHFKMEFVKAGYAWILQVHTAQYAEVRRIWKMQTPEMWKRYKSWGVFDEHREVVLLRKAINDLRAAIVSRSRADFYKKSKRALKKNKTKAGLKAAGSVPQDN